MTVAELDERMSADELTHWRLFLKLEAERSKARKPSSTDTDPD